MRANIENGPQLWQSSQRTLVFDGSHHAMRETAPVR